MLILSRRSGQGLVLDGGIRVDILASDGRTVRLGITAPEHVRILRSELVESVEEETRRAVQAAATWAARPERGIGLSPLAGPSAVRPPATG